ncbi:DNA-binding transcriptional LysR family regulator [Streptosporangium becharense]|uniref:DNA-binding transcriptional LysR family regulator n=1 Tax=Streptosporangium becharense TaxID=1816182 RepID=A0A7W9MH83_9ACTN|nr:LysR family transcriptional regulator [Streptosporangium becharense]MBB2914712.1 DNA-binding transcriptional LysR family regulator [Streptosporangium becharense]MBB5820887.1 DNA-binding transcriptional LysR family regulator [Streptosporangium becharense]
MVIDTRRLRTLRAVADHGTVTAAAAALHLTPSAVSQQLIALEHEVGHRLLERDGRGVRLTAVGRILLGHANEVLAQLERAGADIAAYTAGTAGEVKAASFATAIGLVVAPAMATLAGKEPGIRVRVRDAEGDQSLTMVLDGVVDVAVAVEYRGAPAEDDRRLTRFPLYAEPFDVVLPLDHPLSGDEVAVADLCGERWIGPYPGNPCHDVITLACEHAGFAPDFAHSSDDFSAVVALAAAGAGVAMVPRLALRGTDLSGVVVRPVPGPERRVFAAVRRGAERHPLLVPLLDTLQDTAAALRRVTGATFHGPWPER